MTINRLRLTTKKAAIYALPTGYQILIFGKGEGRPCIRRWSTNDLKIAVNIIEQEIGHETPTEASPKE